MSDTNGTPGSDGSSDQPWGAGQDGQGQQPSGQTPPQQPYGQSYPAGPSYPAGQQYPGDQQYGGQQYGGQPYPGPVNPLPPKHQSATTSMVIGIIAVAGGLMCLLPLLASPFAWVMGGRAVKEIDASGGTLGGRGEAQAGRILGIIGTVLLILGVLAVVAFVALIAIGIGTSSTTSYSY